MRAYPGRFSGVQYRLTDVSAKPSVNLDDDGRRAYCVYRGKSGATGGVELDVFFPADDDPAAVQQTLKTFVDANPGAAYAPEAGPHADEAWFSLAVPQRGYAPFAANAVRRGDLVFSLSLPASPAAKLELLHLSQLVLIRLAR